MIVRLELVLNAGVVEVEMGVDDSNCFLLALMDLDELECEDLVVVIESVVEYVDVGSSVVDEDVELNLEAVLQLLVADLT